MKSFLILSIVNCCLYWKYYFEKFLDNIVAIYEENIQYKIYSYFKLPITDSRFYITFLGVNSFSPCLYNNGVE